MSCGHKGDLRISVSPDLKEVIIKGCCLQQPFKIISISEFRKSENLLSELKKIHYESNAMLPANNVMCRDEVECDMCNYSISEVQVSLSHACNLSCPMCLSKSKHNEELKNLYFETLYKIKGHKLKSIGLTMEGEPFIYLKETLEYLASLSTEDTRSVSIITNATLLDKNIIKQLYDIQERTGVRFNIQVSCDAITKFVYKKTRSQNKFKTVLQNIKMLNKLGMLTNIIFTAQKCNFHQIKWLNIFWKLHGVNPTKVCVMPVNSMPESQESSMRAFEYYRKNKC